MKPVPGYEIAGVAACLLALGAPVPVAAKLARIAAPAAIATVNRDWLPAMTACDGARLARPYAPDGIFVTASGEVIKGRSAIADFYRRRLTPCLHILGGDIASEVFRDGPGVIYEIGAAHTVVEARDGRRVTRGGRYLTVWKVQADGRWRIVRNLVM